MNSNSLPRKIRLKLAELLYTGKIAALPEDDDSPLYSFFNEKESDLKRCLQAFVLIDGLPPTDEKANELKHKLRLTLSGLPSNYTRFSDHITDTSISWLPKVYRCYSLYVLYQPKPSTHWVTHFMAPKEEPKEANADSDLYQVKPAL